MNQKELISKKKELDKQLRALIHQFEEETQSKITFLEANKFNKREKYFSTICIAQLTKYSK